MKTRFIVSSKVFRRFLKRVLEQLIPEGETEYTVYIHEDIMCIQGQEMCITCKEPGVFAIDHSAVERMVKVLKHLQEQPISIEINDSRLMLTCAVL